MDQITARLTNCGDPIYSNDYADYIIEYTGYEPTIIERYNPECIQFVSNRYVIIHVPNTDTRAVAWNKFGYHAIPKCYGLLDSSSMEASGIQRVKRQPYLNLFGRDVIIGFIDTGIDYTHKVFKNADNTSRIISIWDQTIRTGLPPNGISYGTEYKKIQIDEALASDNPLSIVPSVDENGHGTFLAGIAAGGEDRENDFTGVASSAGIVMVKLKPVKPYLRDFFLVKEDAVCYQENDVMMAVRYLQNVAFEQLKPLVICLGIGSNEGGHEGNTSLPEFLDSIADVAGIGIIVAGGNEVNRGHHYLGTIEASQSHEDVEIKVDAKESERGFSAEMWVSAPNVLSVGFISPTGELIEKIAPRLNQSQTIHLILERTVIDVNFELIEKKTGDELILIRFDKPTPGIWKIRVYNDGKSYATYHIWMLMDTFISEDTFFLQPDPYTTICEAGNATKLLTVAAYDHVSGSIYTHSSRGNTRSNLQEPDITAPGVNVFGPVPGGTYGRKTGTSVASAHIAGASALLLEWGLIEGNDITMDTTEIKKYLIRGANRGNIIYPNREWGYGTLDLYETFESLRTTL